MYSTSWGVCVSNSDIQGCALIVLLGLGVAALMWRVLNAVWREHCPRITALGKAACVALLLAIAAVGGDKSPAARVLATFVTALRDGTLLDPSGKLGAAASVAAAQVAAEAAGQIVGAASSTVAEAQALFDDAADTLNNRGQRVAYLAADMPRANPNLHTNANIAATIQRVRQDGATNLLAWVWFSEVPEIDPRVAMAYSVASNVWAYLDGITNSYPETVDVEGVPCVEYRFAIPEAAQGIPFRPEYELGFGGARGEPLIVPDGGVIVVTGGVQRLPFTGTDVYSDDLSVTYKGGIAVAANYFGTNYTGSVTL